MEMERVPIFLKYGNDWRKNGATLHHHELTQKMSHFNAKNHEAGSEILTYNKKNRFSEVKFRENWKKLTFSIHDNQNENSKRFDGKHREIRKIGFCPTFQQIDAKIHQIAILVL